MEHLKQETTSGTQLNLDALYKLFPQCFTEARDEVTGKMHRVVNFTALRELLGDDTIEDAPEAYEFTWVGKQAAKREAARPIRKTLRPCPEESVDWETTQNLYIEGDNLEVLKLLQASYMGKVKMIYIDPPYNTGNDFVYHDDFAVSLDEYDQASGNVGEDGERFRKNTETNGRFHSDWCSMMYSRLLVARSLLKDDGIIFISIDDNEQRNMKNICDEVFGETNMVNTFIWNCSTAGGIRPKFASKTHEYIYCYAKNKDVLPMLYAPLSEDAIKMYNQKDEKGLYRDKDFVFKNKSTNINQKYFIECPDGELVKPKDGYIYRFIRESFDEALQQGLVSFKKTNTGPLVTADGIQAHWNIYIKKYLGDALGAPSTLIPKEMMSIYNVGTQTVQTLFDNVRVFENVKPVDVIAYLVKMITSDSIVLDFFSGSATTAHAVMQLNAEDGGTRKFIMVQLPEETDAKSEANKAGYKNICEIGKERIRRAGRKIKADAGLQGQDLDIGFRVYKCDESNMEDVYFQPKEYTQDTLLAMLDNIKSDRTDLDLLFGCMLDWGVELSLPLSKQTVDSCDIHIVNEGDLVACFSQNVTEKVIDAIAELDPLRVVFRDSCFDEASSKMNLFELFKQKCNWSEEEAKNNIRVI